MMGANDGAVRYAGAALFEDLELRLRPFWGDEAPVVGMRRLLRYDPNHFSDSPAA
jgi:hypothetical protein